MISAADLDLVEDAFRAAIASDVGVLSQARQYIIRSGGKRIRPRLVLLPCKAAGGTDVTRAVPARWGDGLALYDRRLHIHETASADPRHGGRVIRGRGDLCAATVEAEMLQKLCLGDTVMTEEVNQGVVRRKTASLFSACLSSVAVLAEGSKQKTSRRATKALVVFPWPEARAALIDLADSAIDRGS